MALHERTRARLLRKARIRKKLKFSGERPRLCVFRSGKHIYAQIIDDVAQKTLVAASTLSKEVKGNVKKTSTIDAAKKVGELIAKMAIEKKIENVCFDRGGYLYHGRVKALADAARSQGLHF